MTRVPLHLLAVLAIAVGVAVSEVVWHVLFGGWWP
jgi:hypothetical protein